MPWNLPEKVVSVSLLQRFLPPTSPQPPTVYIFGHMGVHVAVYTYHKFIYTHTPGMCIACVHLTVHIVHVVISNRHFIWAFSICE